MGVNKYFSVVFWIVGRSKNPILLERSGNYNTSKTDAAPWYYKQDGDGDGGIEHLMELVTYDDCGDKGVTTNYHIAISPAMVASLGRNCPVTTAVCTQSY